MDNYEQSNNMCVFNQIFNSNVMTGSHLSVKELILSFITISPEAHDGGQVHGRSYQPVQTSSVSEG